MKRKYFTYILLVVFSLFMFDSRVEASKKDGYDVSCDDMNLDKNYKIFDSKDYDVSCVYKHEVVSGYEYKKASNILDAVKFWERKVEKNNCYVVQIAYNNDDSSNSKVKFESLSSSWDKNYKNVTGHVSFDMNRGSFEKNNCPTNLYFHNSTSGTKAENAKGYFIDNIKNNTGIMMPPVSSFYNGKVVEPQKIGSDNADFGDWKNLECVDILGDELVGYLQSFVNILKVGVPILLIVFGTLDFARAIFSFDEGEMKKAQTKFIKRVIIAVAFFLIPTFLGVILDIANKIWPSIDNTLCGIDF